MAEDPKPNRFVEPLSRTPACWTCKHKHAGAPTCKAFPDGIPGEILDGRNQHREPVPRDNGIQYERE